MSKMKNKNTFFEKLATFIVDKRSLFFLLYIFVAIFCVFSMSWVKVENDVTTYLPEDTETRQGIEAMNENFVAFATARVMVSNVTYETAEELYAVIQDIDGISMVVFDDTPEHYTGASALYDVNFDGAALDPACIEAVETIRQKLDGYDLAIDTTVGYDDNAMLRGEMTTILVVAVVIMLSVLVLASRSYAEIPVLILTFGMAALMNMGTNFIFEKISFISDSVAVVLQLALAIDYAIILCHRYIDERETLSAREAAIAALAKAIPEVSASSLTTVSGLMALGFMKFAIGMDMAMVLIKAILLSLLSVFTLKNGCQLFGQKVFGGFDIRCAALNNITRAVFDVPGEGESHNVGKQLIPHIFHKSLSAFCVIYPEGILGYDLYKGNGYYCQRQDPKIFDQVGKSA